MLTYNGENNTFIHAFLPLVNIKKRSTIGPFFFQTASKKASPFHKTHTMAWPQDTAKTYLEASRTSPPQKNQAKSKAENTLNA